MGVGARFDPRVIAVPVGVVGDLLDELVSALAKSAKGGEGDRLEVDVQALLLDDAVRATILVGGHLLYIHVHARARSLDSQLTQFLGTFLICCADRSDGARPILMPYSQYCIATSVH